MVATLPMKHIKKIMQIKTLLNCYAIVPFDETPLHFNYFIKYNEFFY